MTQRTTPAPDAPDREEIDRLVADFAAERTCSSVAWGVVLDGELALTGSTGDANGAAPTEQTVYRIASMTKSFSAAITLLLRDEGALRLDAALGEYAPELADVRSPTTDAPPITVRDLLCMSSGLVTDDPWADRHLDLTDDEFDEIVRGGLVFAQPTGACHEYSNFGFALLGRVIHRATGVRLRDHVSERLLAPLGMTRTTWDQPEHDDWARPMRCDDGAWSEELPTPPDGLIAPMGGIWTTVADLARWVAWLADAFPARNDDDAGPLSRASRREMQTPQRYVGRRTLRGVRFPSSYGYGVRILDEPGLGTVVSHSGGLPGYGSNMRWTPGGAVGVVTLSNTTYAPMTELGARIHDRLHGLGLGAPATPPPSDRLDRIARALIEVLSTWAAGDEVADDALARVFADNVEPDDAFTHRAARARTHGVLSVDEVQATSDAAARVECHGDDRRYVVTLSLAPTQPARVQQYEVKPADG